MPFYDFERIKAEVDIVDAAQKLGLTLRKSGAGFRSPCPLCKTEDTRGLVITPGKGFYCFAVQKGGDVIGLVAHTQNTDMKGAAKWLTEQYQLGTVPTSTVDSTVNRKDRATEPQNEKPGPNQALAPLDYLDAAHPAVEAVGFDELTAKELGIGYAPKGIMRGTVAVPIRLPDGSLAGYIGVTEARLPPSFKGVATNVVRLKTA